MLNYLIVECLDVYTSILLAGLAKGKSQWINMVWVDQEVKADESW